MNFLRFSTSLILTIFAFGCTESQTTNPDDQSKEKHTISVEVECIDSVFARYCLDLALDGAKIISVRENYARYRVNGIPETMLNLFDELRFCPGYESTPGMAFRFHETKDPEITLFHSAIVLPSQYKIDERIAFKGPDGEGVLCDRSDWSKLKPLFDKIFGGLDNVNK